jgi:flagellar protein FlaG
MDVQAMTSLGADAARPPKVGGPARAPERRATPAPTDVKAPPEPEPSREQLERVAKMIQKATENSRHRVGISLDEETREPIVRVMDRDTGEVIRQIPPKELVRLAKTLTRLNGLLVDEKA